MCGQLSQGRGKGEMKGMNNVYNFHDFRRCVALAGDMTLMNVGDFFNFEKCLSQGTESKSSRPLLSEVVSVEFRKGSTKMFFKRRHSDA